MPSAGGEGGTIFRRRRALDPGGAQERDGRIAVGDVEDPASHGYFRRSTARCSCCLFILERPSMPIRLASL